MRLCYDATRLADTEEIARRLAQGLHFKHNEDALTLFLSAPLGAGKTTFCCFLLAALGWRGKVPSPTFNLLHSYPLTGLTLHHLDGFRLNAEEFAQLGPENLLTPRTLLVVEWPEKIGNLLQPDLVCYIQHSKKEDLTASRRIEFWAQNRSGKNWLNAMQE